MTAVIFGRGERRRLAHAFEEGTPVLVLATPGRVADLTATLGLAAPLWRECARFVDIPQHVPRHTLDAAMQLAVEHGARGVLAFGGGSPIGLAKALAVEIDLRKVYIPTTFSGSEATNIWAVSDADGKTTSRDERVRADLVIYDADLVDGMPLSLVFVSLFNALAHAIEALYAPNATDDVIEDAQTAVQQLTTAIDILCDGDEPEARSLALRGAYHAGRALDEAQMGLHHKLAHVLGGTFSLPHSQVHTVLLPYSLEYNQDFAPIAMARLTTAMGAEPVAHLHELQRRSGVVVALRDLGMEREQIGRAVDELFERPYPNPRPLEAEALRNLLLRAFDGESASR